MINIYNSNNVTSCFFKVLAISVYLIVLSLFFCISANAQSAPNISPVTGAYSSQPNNGTQTVTIGGTITTGDQLTITVYDHGLTQAYEPVSYTVASSDTLTTIATNLTLAINSDTNLQAIHVSVTSIGATISITSASSNTTSYNSSINSGATETLTLPINVTITGDSGATFYYTTDGSIPTTSSPQYLAPFNITSTTTVKAIEELSGSTSPVTTSFIQIDASSAALSKTGMQLWLKSDNSVTTNSGNVSAWGDISGNSNNATQSTSSSQPTVKTNAINNLPSIVFNGSQDYFTLPSGFSNFTAGATVFFICKPLANSNFQFFDFANGTDWNNRFDMWQYTNNGAQFEVFTSNTGTSLNGDSKLNGLQAAIVGNYSILEVTHDGVNTGNLYSNGVLQSTNIQMNPITNVTRTNNLIGKYSLGNSYINGEIAEIIIYNRQLNTSERQLAEKYLIQRYGMPLVPPVISPDAIINATGSQSVTMIAELGNVIHYTTDGSTPTINSPLYTNSFQVTTTTTVKAISVNGTNTSSVTTSSIMFDSSTANLPRNGLSLWLRSDSGVSVNSTNNVLIWRDSSNNGMDASQPASLASPILQNTSANGQPEIVFNGTNSSLQLPTGFADFTNGLTAFFVCKPVLGSSSVFFDFSDGINWNNRIDMWQYTTNGAQFEVFDSGANDSQLSGSSAATLGNYQLLQIVHDGTSTATMYTNSTQQTQNTSMHSITNINRVSNYIGQYSLGNSAFFNGKMSEIIFFNRALSATEIKNVQAYLAYRYAPNINPVTGVYSGGFVNITAYSGSPIKYTLDGTTPNINSPEFSQPLNIVSSTTIKAVTSTSLGLSTIGTAYLNIDPAAAAAVPKTNLNLWLKPDYGVLTNGSNVSNWIDFSGLYNNATQANSTNQPQLLQNQINNFNSISFNGTSSNLQLPSGFTNFTSGASGFVVLKPKAFLNYSSIFNLSNGTAGNGLSLTLAQPNGFGLTTQTGSNSTTINATTGATTNQYQLLEFTHNGASLATLFNNAAEITSSSTMNNIDNITRLSNFIGSDYSGNNLLTADIAEMIVYNTGLSYTDKGAIEGYLLQKYQLSGVLPNGPVFSLPASTLTSPVSVMIQAPIDAEAYPTSIYYTTDASTPTTSLSLYTSPIAINYTTTLKAICVNNGVSSSVTSATYTLNSNEFSKPSSSDTTTPVINLQVP